jgi:solute:Na+ symporter, SSS family
MTFDPTVVAIVVLYLFGMLALGVWVGRKKISSADDFMVAGRRLPWFVLAATLAATEVGGGSSMGVVKKAYGEWGLGAAWYIWTMAATFAVFALVAPALSRTRCRTIPEYFGKRYGASSSAITAVLMIVALVGLSAVQMVATGLVITIMTGVDYRTAVIAAGAIVTVYTYYGGMWSVSLTDFVQWIFIVVGLGAAIPYALSAAGGSTNVLATLPAQSLDLFSKIGGEEIVSLMAIYITSFLVGQEAMQRLYSAKSEAHARAGAFATSGFYLLFGFIPPVLGLLALSLARQGILPIDQLEQIGANAMLPLLAQYCLPSILTGVLFAGLISATMSSADSNLLGAASIWANDLEALFRRQQRDAEASMKSAKRAVIVIGTLSTFVAAMNFKDLIDVLKFSFTLRAAGPFFPFLLGHYWKGGSPFGSLLALVGATAVVAVLVAFGIRPLGFDPVFPGLLTGLVLYLGGSVMRPASSGDAT